MLWEHIIQDSNLNVLCTRVTQHLPKVIKCTLSSEARDQVRTWGGREWRVSQADGTQLYKG